jgi:hypothetical protein
MPKEIFKLKLRSFAIITSHKYCSKWSFFSQEEKQTLTYAMPMTSVALELQKNETKILLDAGTVNV